MKFFYLTFIFVWLTQFPEGAFGYSPGSHDTLSATIDSLNKIHPSSPYFSIAQQKLAEYYLTQNTVASRKKSIVCIDKALRVEPGNVDFLITRMHILFEQGFYRAANESCDRVLSIPSGPGNNYRLNFAEAYYYKGLIAERFALKYKDMISVVDNDNYVSLAPYGAEDLQRAAHYYEKALEFNSTHRDALLHLGLLYFEIQSYTPMARLFESIIAENKSDKDAYAFAALAYYHSFQYEKSQDYYQKAMNFMSEEELAAFNHIGYIVPQSDQKQYQNGSTAPLQAADFQKVFWDQKDPFYLTKYNERQLEHFNRMTYVNLRFSVPRLNIAGWKTDRGMIFIRYGKPNLSYKTQPDERNLGGSETWIYPDFSFTFYDEYASGHFLMDQKSYLASRSAFNTREDIFEMPKEKTFTLQSRLYQFKGSQGTTRARVYFQAPVDAIQSQSEQSNSGVEAECGLFFLDRSARILHESRKHIELSFKDTADQNFGGYIELSHLPFQAGEQRYSFEIMTTVDRRAGVSRNGVEIKNFNGDRLMLSDVIIASSITEENEIKIIPNFTHAFSRNENLYLYFEVYNLSLDDESRGRFKVSARIQPHGKSGIVGAIKDMLYDKKEGRIGSSFEVTSYSRDDRYYFGINPADIPSGSYDLYLQITDMIAHTSVESVLPVTIHP